MRIYLIISNLFSYLFYLFYKIFGLYQISLLIAYIPTQFGNQIRYFFYKKIFKKLGKNVLFSYGCIFTHADIKIGDNVRFGPFNTIANVDFGNNILIAQSVHFMSGKHQHGILKNDLIMNQPGEISKIIIGDDCWIGVGSIILANLGRGSVIGAGSIVIKETEEYGVFAGNPAKLIKYRV